MKKQWHAPSIEVLDVKNTFGHQPGCKPSGGRPQKCDHS